MLIKFDIYEENVNKKGDFLFKKFGSVPTHSFLQS